MDTFMIRKIFSARRRKGWLAGGLVVAAFLGYALIFHIIFPFTGSMAASLAIIPVLWAGWRLGARAGMAAGVFSYFLNGALLSLAGMSAAESFFNWAGILGTALIVLMGAGAGHGHAVTARLAEQIKENKAAEAALRGSEEKVRRLLAGLPVGIYQSTPEGELLFANAALANLLGYAGSESLLANNVKELYVEEEQRERWKRQIDEEGIVREFQVALRRRDGSTFWAEDNAHIVRDEQGRVAYYEGSLMDISARKRAEQAVLASEAKYRNLMHNIPQRVFNKDTNLVYIAANPSYARDFNLAPEDFVGKTDFDFFPAELAEKYRADDRQVLQTGMPIDLEEDYYHNGNKRTVKTVKAPVYDDRGEISGILGLFWDITERKEMEEALRRSEQRYYGLFEHSPVSLWEEDFSQVKEIVDRLKSAGVDDFERYFADHPEAVRQCMASIGVMDVNRATLDLYRAASKDELLSNLSRVITASTEDMFREELVAIAAGERVFASEGKNCTLAGETLDIQLSWSVAPGYEETYGKVFVSIVDVTERKRAEQGLQGQKAKAEALVEISQALSLAGLEPEVIEDIIVRRTAQVTGDACLLTLVSAEDGSMHVAGWHHPDPQVGELMEQRLTGTPKQPGEGAIRQLLKSGRPVVWPAVCLEELGELGDPELEAFLYHYGAQSLLIMPLVSEGRVMGTLGMARNRPGDPYTEECLAFMQHLSGQAALTITNARLHELVRQQARSDPLTGVYNRRHFFNLAKQEFKRSERNGAPLSMILLDVDYFKEINDTYGHNSGDQVLQYVAEQCRTNIRPTDVVGRFGGDEFTILLPETDLAGARCLAERLRTIIAATPVEADKTPLPVTISLGVARKSAETSSLVALIHKVDEAMYAAKRAGRNRMACLEWTFGGFTLESAQDSKDGDVKLNIT